MVEDTRYHVRPEDVRGQLTVRIKRGRKYGRLVIDTDRPWCFGTPEIGPIYWRLDTTAFRRLLDLTGALEWVTKGRGDRDLTPGGVELGRSPGHSPIAYKGGYVGVYGISLWGVPLAMLDHAAAICEAIVRASCPWVVDS